jgi:sensor histidine kinase YesM
MALLTKELSPDTSGTPGKLWWRRHELIFVTLFALIRMARDLWDKFTLTDQQIEPAYKIPYFQHGQAFNYNTNVLFPQLNTVLVLYLVYLGVNKVIIPLFKKLSWQAATSTILLRLVLIAFVYTLLSWFLALGFNSATYYAHPWYFNYSGFQLLSLLGYNDHPQQSLFTGFDRALSLVGVVLLLGCVRELIMNYIERRRNNRAFWILVFNQITLAALVYWTALAMILLFNIFSGAAFRIIYVGFIPSTFLVFMANTYWLFPGNEGKPVFNIRALLKLLLFTYLFTYFCFTFDGWEQPNKIFIFNMICWGMQLFITTPVSWLIYQQRKDRILQLRGVEKALEESKAHLQFLRSQINPHFLFNALNTLYGTALREKAPDSAAGIQMLGDMMRFMLHENHLDFIPMHKEIEYLNNYIALQKLRTQVSGDILIEDHITEQGRDHPIAPMLLIPFVENAFKHGISLREKSWISVSLTCDEQTIRFEVRNSVHPRSEQDPEKEASGIGLKNVVERLRMVYPNKHAITVDTHEHEFVVRLSITP